MDTEQAIIVCFFPADGKSPQLTCGVLPSTWLVDAWLVTRVATWTNHLCYKAINWINFSEKKKRLKYRLRVKYSIYKLRAKLCANWTLVEAVVQRTQQWQQVWASGDERGSHRTPAAAHTTHTHTHTSQASTATTTSRVRVHGGGVGSGEECQRRTGSSDEKELCVWDKEKV